MVYPQNNAKRRVIETPGIWMLKPDPDGIGEESRWQKGFDDGIPVGVPGSLNEQLAELGLMYYTGAAWYQVELELPRLDTEQRALLWFGSADHNAVVWVNGVRVGEHAGGYIPFELDITSSLKPGRNRIIARVDNILTHDTIPQGVTVEDFEAFNIPRVESFPPTLPDFLIYGGLPRPVRISFVDKQRIDSLRLHSTLAGTKGEIEWTVNTTPEVGLHAVVKAVLWDGETEICSAESTVSEYSASGNLTVQNVKPWSPADPYLYRIEFTLTVGDQIVDSYTEEHGIREIRLEGNKLLLNGEPIFLTGFGKHEDFAVLGKGLSMPVVVKDFHLMKWIGANSFRTSHYPYADEIMRLADRMGFLVIDEVPAVSVNFRFVTEKTLESHKRALTELIERDRNHACVIAWSIANEPGIWGEEEAASEAAHEYWRTIALHTRGLDDSRPITLPTCPKQGMKDPSYEHVDFISVNRYWGWYEVPTDLDRALKKFRDEMREIHERFGKPILVTELGADTIEGLHSTVPQFFTEEFQADFIDAYFDVIEEDPWFLGEHIWNFADFRTAQHHRRVVLNRKGVFNRQRDPKLAAFRVRDRWKK